LSAHGEPGTHPNDGMDTPQLREHRLPHEFKVSRWDRVRTRVLRSLAVLMIVGLGLAAAGLTANGVDSFFGQGPTESEVSRAGGALAGEGEDGWRSIVEATPTLLMLFADDRDDLASASLISMDESPAIVVFPADVNLGEPGFTLQRAWQERDVAEVRSLVADHLGTGIDAVTVLDASAWTAVLLGRDVQVELGESLSSRQSATSIAAVDTAETGASGGTGFQRGFLPGPVTLRADLVPAFAGWVDEGEDLRLRLGRQVRLWDGILARFSGDNSASLDAAEKVNRVRQGLTDAQLTAETLIMVLEYLAEGAATVEAAPLLDGVSLGDTATLDLDPGATAAQLRAAISRPAPVDPRAPTVRLINGVNNDVELDQVRSLVARGGLQLVAEGNDFAGAHRANRVILHGLDGGAEAQQLASVLGVEVVETDRDPDDGSSVGSSPVDVTIVIGPDSLQTGTTN